jgi:hydrogenase-4 component F
MTLIGLVLVPLLAAIAALVAPRRRWLETITLAGAIVTLLFALAVTGAVLANGRVAALGDWLFADALSALIALVTAFVGFTAALYSIGYLREDMKYQDAEHGAGLARVRRYYVLFNLFVFTMLVVPLSNSLGILWIAIEGTTLASLFLVSFYGTREALEAAWKYVIVGSVGLALALFGTVLFYRAAVQALGENYALTWTAVAPVAARLDPSVLQLAFLFIVVGYGTKAGLAPMHTWLPDAHSEAPSPVSALLSGVLLNCAMYGILRFYSLCAPALGAAYVNHLLLGFGLVSLVIAALFIWRQQDYKRMLAYSSVEHMGLIAAGVAFGGALGLYAALLQLVNHALTKSLMFFASGNVLLKYETKSIDRVSGIARLMPATGAMLLLGGLAITGSPPFGMFISEFSILRAGFGNGETPAAIALIVLLGLIFISFLFYLNKMVFGKVTGDAPRGETSRLGLAAMGLSLALILALGIFIPSPLNDLLRQAAAVLGG